MKKLLLAAMLVVGMVGGAYAEEENLSLQIDQTFVKARTWLSQQNLSLTGSPSGRDDNAAFSQEAILFYGEGIGNTNPSLSQTQKEMLTKRAAVVVAQRAVAEYMNGFTIVGDTLVKDGVLQYDTIRSAVSGLVKGTQIVVEEYNKEKDTAVAILKVGMHGPKGFASVMYDKILGDPQLKKSLTELNGKPAPVFKPEVIPPADNYDGLIIDATEQNFRPALINRIFSSKSELLYDPSKVSQKILVEQGCGEYTNTVEKAKAALESRGIKNPLVVKASGTISASDLQVADADAATIFAANQKGNFLAGAKVAFVLK